MIKENRRRQECRRGTQECISWACSPSNGMKTFDQGRTPWSARVPLDPLSQALTNTSSKPTGASAADQGVRPTLHSSIRDHAPPMLKLIYFFAAAIATLQAAPTVTKIDPPFWWVGYSINPVRLLIRGTGLTGATVKAATKGIELGEPRVNASGTYMFVDATIRRAGSYPLKITTADGSTTAAFEALTPLAREGRFQGFSQDAHPRPPAAGPQGGQLEPARRWLRSSWSDLRRPTLRFDDCRLGKLCPPAPRQGFRYLRFSCCGPRSRSPTHRREGSLRSARTAEAREPLNRQRQPDIAGPADRNFGCRAVEHIG